GGASGRSGGGRGVGGWRGGGRRGRGRGGQGVVSVESVYQKGSARRPESTAGWAVGSVTARSRVARRIRCSSWHWGTRKRMVAPVTSAFSRAAAWRSVW